MGITCEISLIDDDPTEEQAVLFERLIRSLRDMPTEFLIFEFRNAKNGPGEQQGLVFFQLCRENGAIHSEVRIDRKDGIHMYARRMNDGETIGLLRWMIRTRTAPDINGWEDITEQALREPDDSEFE